MQFTMTIVAAIFATVSLAAPKAAVSEQSAANYAPVLSADTIARLEAGLASPAVTARGLDKRDITHLFVCTDANFQGQCQNLATDREVCHFLGNGFDNSITSLGPDNDGTQCCIFDNSDCTGASVCQIHAPGINNLNDFGFNDRASSYRC